MSSGREARPASQASEREFRIAFCAGLQARREEIEAAVINRVCSISDPAEVGDPEYVDGLLDTVAVSIDYAMCAIERGEQRTPTPPPSLLAQARFAARCGVGLDTVLRRYLAGYSVLGDFLLHEVREGGYGELDSFANFLHGHGAVLDRLIAAVSEDYLREARSRPDSTEQRRIERVEQLLAGELIDASDLVYDFAGIHCAVVAVGPAAPAVLRDIAASLDCQLLLVRRQEDTYWAWLGTSRSMHSQRVKEKLSKASLVRAAIGEPARGIAGWRLSHRQAAAALRVVQRTEERVSRYADLALLSSMVEDELLVASMRQLYLAPLEGQRDRGDVARRTLRAYFQVDRNISSAAAILGVSRNTVAHRLRAIEASLGRSISSCALELEASMMLEPLLSEPEKATGAIAERS